VSISPTEKSTREKILPHHLSMKQIRGTPTNRKTHPTQNSLVISGLQNSLSRCPCFPLEKRGTAGNPHSRKVLILKLGQEKISYKKNVL
jgi:hypothetical protein